MWRAAPITYERADSKNVALPEVRTFFFSPPPCLTQPFNSGRKVISASAAFEADPLGDTCLRGRGLLPSGAG